MYIYGCFTFIDSKNNNDSDNSDNSDEEDEEDEIPFACFICRSKFTLECQPVITSCNHYFCLQCINKKLKCAVCSKVTNGVFNRATKLIKRIIEQQGIEINNHITTNKISSWDVIEG